MHIFIALVLMLQCFYHSKIIYLNFHYPIGIAGNCTSGEVQLVDGKSKYEGRLEVCYEGSWTSLCSSGVNSHVAAVVCRQLNFTTIGNIV